MATPKDKIITPDKTEIEKISYELVTKMLEDLQHYNGPSNNSLKELLKQYNAINMPPEKAVDQNANQTAPAPKTTASLAKFENSVLSYIRSLRNS